MSRRYSLVLLVLAAAPVAADWPQFRGPGGLGVAAGKNFPVAWSDTENLAWKTALPGPGGSSPIVVGDKIFITCYSGYGLERNDPGDLKNLKRHLICLDPKGQILWKRDIVTDAKDYAFTSFQALHGYASSTPASDGKNIYCFFGVAGVVAFDMSGNELWRQTVGTGTSDWGSGTSPILAGDLVIVNASVESESIVALNKKGGSVAWSQKGITYSWTTPLLLTANGRQEVVVSLYNEIHSYDPNSGKLLWHCQGLPDYVCPSPVAHDGVVYVIGARNNTAMAVKAGGDGDVTKSHVLWTIRRGSNVSSPLYHDGHLYWAHEGNGVVYCVNAATGKIVYEERLDPQPDRVYASAFVAGGKIYYVSRDSGTYVIDASPQFKQVTHNVLKSDNSVFQGSPAALDGKLLLRSDRYLYCIGPKK